MNSTTRLSDVAEVLGISPTSFRIFFNTLSPNIQRHKLPSTTRGKKGIAYAYADICTVMRTHLNYWTPIHEERLYRIIQEREHA